MIVYLIRCSVLLDDGWAVGQGGLVVLTEVQVRETVARMRLPDERVRAATLRTFLANPAGFTVLTWARRYGVIR